MKPEFFEYPTVYVIGHSRPNMNEIGWFVDTFNPDWRISYRHDCWTPAAISKTAGQLCYQSFGPGRTTIADEYIAKIIKQGHGSVLEHVSATLAIRGIDRAVTHELIRHRVGMSYSQLSQRYVTDVNFVIPPGLTDAEKHTLMEHLKDVYSMYKDEVIETGKVSERKSTNEIARRILPNCTEAPIVVTGNMRAWRHFLELRGSIHADASIRLLAVKVLERLKENFSEFFQDYTVEDGVIKVNK